MEFVAWTLHFGIVIISFGLTFARISKPVQLLSLSD